MEKRAVNRDAMVAQLEKEKKPQFYKAQSDEYKKELVSASVGNMMLSLEMAYQTGEIDLSDTPLVKEQTFEYLHACQQTGTFPTLLGLAAALGRGRRTVYDFMHNKPAHPTTKFLSAFQASCANIIAQQGLNRNADQAMSIFLLKNSNQGLQDKIELQAIPTEEKPELSASEIAEKYGAIISDFEYTEDQTATKLLEGSESND